MRPRSLVFLAKDGNGKTCAYTNRCALELGRHFLEKHDAVATSSKFPDVFGYLDLDLEKEQRKIWKYQSLIQNFEFRSDMTAAEKEQYHFQIDIWMYNIEREWTKIKEHFAEFPKKTDAATTNAAETDAAGDDSAAVDDAAIDAAMDDAAMGDAAMDDTAMDDAAVDDAAMDDAAMDDAAVDGAGLIVRCPIRVDADSEVSLDGGSRRTMTIKCVMEVVTHVKEEHRIDEKVREDKYQTFGGDADMSNAE